MGRNCKLQVKTVTQLWHKIYNSHIHPECVEDMFEAAGTTSPGPGFGVEYLGKYLCNLSILPSPVYLSELYLVLMDCGSVPTPIIGKLHYFSLIFNEVPPPLSCWL